MEAVTDGVGPEGSVRKQHVAESQGSLAGVAAAGLGYYLNRRGIDGTALLLKAGLTQCEITDRYAYIPVSIMAKALELAARATGDPCVGLHFGESYDPSVLHACNYAIMNAPDLRTALHSLAAHRNVVVNIPTKLTDCGTLGIFNWTFHERFDAPEQITDFTVMRTLRHIQKAAGKDWLPLAAYLTHDEPEDTSEYRRILGPNIHFGQPENSFLIGADVLATPMPNADPDLYRVARCSYQTTLPLKLDESNPLDRIRKFVGERLEKRAGTLNTTAQHMAMTAHQLRALLKRHNTCFQCLVDDTRKSLAEHYLTHTDLQLSEIAFLMGFSDQSVFTRAAKRWFGVTPKQMRRLQTGLGA